MQNNLKPCPFCGNEAPFGRRSVQLMGINFDSWHSFQCLACNAAIGHDDNRFRVKDDALNAWNRRADIAQKAQKNVCEDILRIMKVYHAQAEAGNVDSPGGIEHMGDVWKLFKQWEKELLA